VPAFLRAKGRDADREYGMLPRSPRRGPSAKPRVAAGGRTLEIQRLIGAAFARRWTSRGWRTHAADRLRCGAGDANAHRLDHRRLVAAYDALRWLQGRQLTADLPLLDFVAAVSVGMHGGRVLVDLDRRGFDCETDMNVVMTGSGGFVEVQGTAEARRTRSRTSTAMLVAARSAIRRAGRGIARRSA